MLILVFAVATTTLTGCIGNGTPTQADEVRNSFIDSTENVSFYEYEGELTRDMTPVNEVGRQVSTTTTEAIIDYENEELKSNLVSVRRQANETRSNTKTYLINGTVYERTESQRLDSGWTRFENSQEVKKTWEARDELGLYAELLGNVSVGMAERDEEVSENDSMHILDVGLDKKERVEFLTGKLGDEASFFEDINIDEFSMRVWISDDDHRLVRAETEVSMTAPNQRTEVGVIDLEVNIESTDEFSYDQPVEIELPEEARGAERLRPETGLGANGSQRQG